MKIGDKHYRSIWVGDDGHRVHIFDQTKFPHSLEVMTLESMTDAAVAIREMKVRGAPLIGAVGAFGLALALREEPTDRALASAFETLLNTRPTAVNLQYCLEEVYDAVKPIEEPARAAVAYKRAQELCNEDAELCEAIGKHGLEVFRELAKKKRGGEPLRILTHCNAGWLATVDWGTALAPIYMAFDEGIPVHVWVDETRPRNQGANLTAWELGQHGVPHSVIVDNAGGHLMQHGLVDVVIVGSDRTTAKGDVCNKIGTYLKALAAHDNGIPFYAALPYTTIDWRIEDGLREIPIEERSQDEVHLLRGKTREGAVETIRVTPVDSSAVNHGFDVTPARLVTGIITERGVCEASREGLRDLYPEQKTQTNPISVG